MRKIISLALVALILVSCSDNLTDLNNNPKSAQVVEGQTLFSNALKNMTNTMTSTNVNLNVFKLYAQYWTETTYLDEANYDLTGRAIPDNFWSAIYRDVLKDLDESAKLITANEALTPDIKANQLAIIEIWTVYAYSQLVIIYGDIPYTEALDFANTTPKYDDALTVYKDLLSRLNAATTKIKTAEDSFGDADILFGGDASKWKKFANSLKLRMGLILADVDNALAKSTIEANFAGAISTNADNALFMYLDSPPNTNPLWVDLVQSGRQDFVGANTFIDALNTLADPRRAAYFEEVTAGGYVGGVYGATSPYNANSHVGDAMHQPDFSGNLFDAAEYHFILAEASARGYNVGGTAAGHYTAGITASMEFWGVDAADIATYLAQPSVAYATATGTYKQKIAYQKWFANYLKGLEAWTDWRRLDFPTLNVPPAANTLTPVRFTYPVREQNLNKGQYDAASEAVGGDLVTTKLFFDKF
ncbi:MAG: SusD/RagB family nutrient-binding outer membrane lipoprotein [Bacteroidetes bacterium]|nr:SusD/RagB family nutrient-binding outer membrane lipoprotein [Bacteroidota bacterium]